jgi:hypothetical protein
MGRALISYTQGRLEESLDHWAEARRQAEVCRTVVTIFIPMIIDFVECDISRRLGKWGDASISLERARRTFEVIGREHRWTCYGTVLLGILCLQFQIAGLVNAGEWLFTGLEE